MNNHLSSLQDTLKIVTYYPTPPIKVFNEYEPPDHNGLGTVQYFPYALIIYHLVIVGIGPILNKDLEFILLI